MNRLTVLPLCTICSRHEIYTYIHAYMYVTITNGRRHVHVSWTGIRLYLVISAKNHTFRSYYNVLERHTISVHIIFEYIIFRLATRSRFDSLARSNTVHSLEPIVAIGLSCYSSVILLIIVVILTKLISYSWLEFAKWILYLHYINYIYSLSKSF